MEQIGCALCTAVKDVSNETKYLWNTPLYETKSFFLIPSIGPFEIGHCIIVSKEHELNLLSMNKEIIKEFLQITDYCIKKMGENILFTEHGPFNQQQTGGACIDHTHIHVIPKVAQFFCILDGVLPINNQIVNLNGLAHNTVIDFPYILTFNPKNEFRLYESYNAYSQMIRKAMCINLNRKDWNWKNNFQIEKIRKTIGLWER